MTIPMRVGAVFPTREIGNDPGAIREFAQAVEDIGFSHLVIFDHVLGADIPGRPRSRQPFHEIFVVLGFIAACTERIELAQAVLVLSQRQTALVAKQAAELDVLTRGRTRLGVGLGWNEIEFVALGANFKDRGRRIEEQIEVLRLMFTQDLVTFRGKWHRLDGAGINPLPVQRPIPIWMGASAEAAVRRVARIGDGWFVQGLPDQSLHDRVETFRGYLRDAGRDPTTFPIEGRLNAMDGGPDDWARGSQFFKDIGLTHVYFSTMDTGCKTVDDHVALLRRFRDASPAFA
jgi:probable F420-dependent oxidoreductase